MITIIRPDAWLAWASPLPYYMQLDVQLASSWRGHLPSASKPPLASGGAVRSLSCTHTHPGEMCVSMFLKCEQIKVWACPAHASVLHSQSVRCLIKIHRKCEAAKCVCILCAECVKQHNIGQNTQDSTHSIENVTLIHQRSMCQCYITLVNMRYSCCLWCKLDADISIMVTMYYTLS